MSRVWDVVIVGAGPAGTTAAFYLSKHGIRTLLLDKSYFPREKTCGDACSPVVCSLLGPLGALSRFETVSAHQVDSVQVVSPTGQSLVARLPKPQAFVLPRRDLDSVLLENALEAGAQFEVRNVKGITYERKFVRILSNVELDVRARAVVGADGAYSVVRRSLGISRNVDKHSAWAVRGYFEVADITLPTALHVLLEKALLPGYAWIFPIGPHRVNVGIGIRGKIREKNLKKLYWKILHSNKHIRRVLRNAVRFGEPRGHFLPLASGLPRTYHDRVLLVGDAASLINPLTGEGIEYALRSGRAAAITLQHAFAAGNLSAKSLRSYEACLFRDIKWNLRLNNWLCTALSYPQILERAVRVARDDQRLKKELMEITFGDKRILSISSFYKFMLG